MRGPRHGPSLRFTMQSQQSSANNSNPILVGVLSLLCHKGALEHNPRTTGCRANSSLHNQHFSYYRRPVRKVNTRILINEIGRTRKHIANLAVADCFLGTMFEKTRRIIIFNHLQQMFFILQRI